MATLALIGDVEVNMEFVSDMLNCMEEKTWTLTAEDESRWSQLWELLQDIEQDYETFQEGK